jgi:hypothetical protein
MKIFYGKAIVDIGGVQKWTVLINVRGRWVVVELVV